ncbi:hypothetical protein [Mycolicibacterium madagascariense]|uniref:hypothetical protein n=1 Tax=Mycolicibacterium madagascariense TaxID=212765 RepID=UPI0013D2A7CA|nr:hypothetical protein [Mycolicibacterium madagascariense]
MSATVTERQDRAVVQWQHRPRSRVAVGRRCGGVTVIEVVEDGTATRPIMITAFGGEHRPNALS